MWNLAEFFFYERRSEDFLSYVFLLSLTHGAQSLKALNLVSVRCGTHLAMEARLFAQAQFTHGQFAHGQFAQKNN